jgi:threonine/homoserine/homoserine lactone efflux protein
MTFFIPASVVYFGVGWLAGVVTVLFLGWMVARNRRDNEAEDAEARNGVSDDA